MFARPIRRGLEGKGLRHPRLPAPGPGPSEVLSGLHQAKVLLTGSPFPCHCLGEAFLDHLFCPPEVVKLAGIRRIS